jgi:iron complex outermembrane receptor protein
VLANQLRLYYRARDSWVSAYLQDRITVSDRWHVMLGGRFDRVLSEQSRSEDRVTEADRLDSRFSPRAGVLYQATDTVSVFANYARPFGGPNTGVDTVNGDALPSRRSEQFEAGVRSQWLQGRLSADVALFQLTQKNLPQQLSFLPGRPTDLTAKARSRGAELEILGRPYRAVDIVGNYAYTDGRYTDDLNYQDNVLPNAARHAGSLWVQTRLDAYGLPPISVGAGAYAAGRRFGDSANSFSMPAYARLDVAGSYGFKFRRSTLTAQVKVSNLLDELYFLAADPRPAFSRLSVTPGTPRTVSVALRVEF